MQLEGPRISKEKLKHVSQSLLSKREGCNRDMGQYFL
jgi:hypothetical protein